MERVISRAVVVGGGWGGLTLPLFVGELIFEN